MSETGLIVILVPLCFGWLAVALTRWSKFGVMTQVLIKLKGLRLQRKASNMFGSDERASNVIESYPKSSNVNEFRI